MDRIAATLGDAARWRIVELLAERPRSVGELAELTGMRQPQTTKHLQTLAKSGIVTVYPLGQRRVYALEPGPLSDLASRLQELAATAEAQQGERDVLARYRAAIEAESKAASRERWADGRTFSFDRVLAASPKTVWRYFVEPELLATWWAPPSMTITDCIIEPTPGGRVVLDYRDAEGSYHSAGQVVAADGPSHLEFDLSVFDAADGVFLTGHYDLTFVADHADTRLHLDLRITDTAIEAVPFIAGIETGWGQVLDNLADVVGAHPTTPHRKDAQS